MVLKSESISFLEPSGPVQACTGIASPVPFCYVFLRFRLYIFARAPASLIDNLRVFPQTLQVSTVIVIHIVPQKCFITCFLICYHEWPHHSTLYSMIYWQDFQKPLFAEIEESGIRRTEDVAVTYFNCYCLFCQSTSLEVVPNVTLKL